MPSWVKNEAAWSRAKEAAKKQGHAGDYAYITGVYKRMTQKADPRRHPGSVAHAPPPQGAPPGEGWQAFECPHRGMYQPESGDFWWPSMGAALHAERYWKSAGGTGLSEYDKESPRGIGALVVQDMGTLSRARVAAGARMFAAKRLRDFRMLGKGPQPELGKLTRKQRKEYPYHGTVDFQGLQIDVENRKGSERKGESEDGTEWRTKMKAHYGEFRGSMGVDGDPVDCYIGPDADSPLAVVVHQKWPGTKKYDEDKVMLGFTSVVDALKAYRAHYDRGGFYGGHTAMPIGKLRRLLTEKRGRMLKGWVELPERIGRALFAGLSKGAGHKYIKRVPYTDAQGRRKYRYYYHEQAAAHAAKEGDRINLRGGGVVDVLSVSDGKVEIKDANTGKVESVPVSELHRRLHAAYGKRMERGAKRMARSLLRRASGVKASPASELWNAYRDRFKSAGIDPEHGRAIIRFIGDLKGWEGDAKVVLAELAADPKWSKYFSPRVQMVAEGAEGLRESEGAAAVRPDHVTRSAALPSGMRLDDVLADARVHVAKLETALGAVDSVGGAAGRALATYAKGIASSEAIVKLQELAAAYPGIAMSEDYQRLESLAAKAHSLAGGGEPDGGKGIAGASSALFVADESGNPTQQRARYRLIEAGEAIASHDPTNGFAKNKSYPSGVQERQYHRDKDHQGVVRENARKLRPELVVNTNPDAANGPPIITSDGIVLGGNSRAMALQMAHAEDGDSREKYIAYLKQNAATFGLSPDDVDKMKAPMLVREVAPDDSSKKNLGVLVRRYNEVFTQSMDPRVDQVARARLVTDGMLDTLSMAMSEKTGEGKDRHPTLRSYLGTKGSKEFVSSMERAGIIDRRNRAAMVRSDGTLNEDGKQFVERLVVGKIVPSPDILGDMSPTQLSALARSAPHIVRASGHGHDIETPLREALETLNYMRRSGIKSVDDLEDTQTLAGYAERSSGDKGGFSDRPRPTKEAMALMRLMTEKSGPVQMSSAFRDLAQHAEKNPANQSDMLSEPKTTAELISDIVKPPQRSLFGKGGVFVGPRGGKWADSAHTIPWKEGAQADWVGKPDPEKRSQRIERSKAAMAQWVKANAEWEATRRSDSCAENSSKCRRAYQAVYDSLDKLGRAMNLDVSKHRGEYARAAAALLRSKGYKASVSDSRSRKKPSAKQQSLFKSSSYKIPEAARNNARQVLKWKEEHGSDVKGMTSVGWGRARQLASNSHVGIETVRKMAAFNRHRKNAEIDPKHKGEPWKDAGYVAWLGWGGTTGVDWARGITVADEGTQKGGMLTEGLHKAGWRQCSLKQALLWKAAGHKYIKRIPTGNPKRPYRYIYRETHDKGVHSEDHMEEGASFKYEDGHYHIEKDHGDGTVTLVHDETGETERVKKSILSRKLKAHHGKAIRSQIAKLRKLYRESQTEQTRERWRKQLEKLGVKAEPRKRKKKEEEPKQEPKGKPSKGGEKPKPSEKKEGKARPDEGAEKRPGAEPKKDAKPEEKPRKRTEVVGRNVGSSVLRRVEFDPNTGAITVHLHNGGVYRYDNETREQYEKIVNADSATAAYRAMQKRRGKGSSVRVKAPVPGKRGKPVTEPSESEWDGNPTHSQEVESSNLAKVEYDAGKGSMVVHMKNGSAYLYANVDKADYDKIVNADSAGGQYHQFRKKRGFGTSTKLKQGGRSQKQRQEGAKQAVKDVVKRAKATRAKAERSKAKAPTARQARAASKKVLTSQRKLAKQLIEGGDPEKIKALVAEIRERSAVADAVAKQRADAGLDPMVSTSEGGALSGVASVLRDALNAVESLKAGGSLPDGGGDSPSLTDAQRKSLSEMKAKIRDEWANSTLVDHADKQPSNAYEASISEAASKELTRRAARALKTSGMDATVAEIDAFLAQLRSSFSGKGRRKGTAKTR